MRSHLPPWTLSSLLLVAASAQASQLADLPVRERARYADALRAEGIATGIHYPVPVHLQPAHADLGYGPGSFPQSERAAGEVLSLPLFPEMTDGQVREVAAAVRAVGAAAGA